MRRRKANCCDAIRLVILSEAKNLGSFSTARQANSQRCFASLNMTWDLHLRLNTAPVLKHTSSFPVEVYFASSRNQCNAIEVCASLTS